jgi:hypothetical protein
MPRNSGFGLEATISCGFWPEIAENSKVIYLLSDFRRFSCLCQAGKSLGNAGKMRMGYPMGVWPLANPRKPCRYEVSEHVPLVCDMAVFSENRMNTGIGGGEIPRQNTRT